MAKEILYRIEFEGAKQQLDNLDKIAEELARIKIEQNKLNADDKKSAEQKQREGELLKAMALERQQAMARERRDILLQQKEYKAQAGTLAQMRIEAQRLGRQLETTWKVGSPEFAKAANQLDMLNRKIREADKSSGNFKSNIGNYAGSIGDAFQGVGLNVGKLTGSLGAATAATGPLGIGLAVLAGGANVLSGAFTATDVIADKFAITMSQLKAATTVFFKAIAEGDFSNFLTNIREAIAEGERYAKVLDYLEDATRGASVSEAKYRNEIAKLKIEMRDVTKTNAERLKAIERIVEIENEIGNERLRLSKQDVDNELKNKSILNQIDKDKLKDLIENYKAYEKQFEFVEKLQDAEKRLREENARSGGGASGFEVADQKEVARLTKLVEGLRKATAGYSQEIIAFGRVNSEERQKIADALIKQYEAEAYANEQTVRAQSTRASLTAEAFRSQEKNIKTVTDATTKLTIEMQRLNEEVLKLVPSWGSIAADARKNITDAIDVQNKLQKAFADARKSPLPTVEDEENVPDEIDTAGVVRRLNDPKFGTQQQLEAASQFVNIWQDAYSMQTQARQQALDEQLKAGLISESKYNKEVGKLKAEQAKKDKTAALIGIAINTAQSIIKTGAELGYPAAIPFQVVAAILGAAQAAVVASQPIPKYAEGGLVIGGKSHAQGGTKFVGSDGSAFEAERGEVLAIVNKHDSKTLRTLSDINSRHGRSFYGQPRGSYFAAGGVFEPNRNIGNSDTSRMVREIVNQIGAIPVEVSLNEIENKAATKRKVNVIGAL